MKYYHLLIPQVLFLTNPSYFQVLCVRYAPRAERESAVHDSAVHDSAVTAALRGAGKQGRSWEAGGSGCCFFIIFFLGGRGVLWRVLVKKRESVWMSEDWKQGFGYVREEKQKTWWEDRDGHCNTTFNQMSTKIQRCSRRVQVSYTRSSTASSASSNSSNGEVR